MALPSCSDTPSEEKAAPHFLFCMEWTKQIKKYLSPMEVMRFRSALHYILQQVLMANTRLGPVYISKVYLADA